MRNRFLAFLLFAAKIVPSYVAFAVACMVPKKRGLWLSGAWMGRKYSDNPKYIHAFLAAHEPHITPIWIVKERDLYRQLCDQGISVAYAYSMAGLRHQLRAEMVVFTHSVADEYLSPLIAPRVRRVQTWHGMPIKKIGYDDNTQQFSNLRKRVRALLFPCDLDRCDLVIAASEADASKYRSAFNVKPDAVRITGYPRNDELIRSVSRRANDKDRRTAIYMPTFRGAVESDFNLFRTSGFDFGKADSVLARIGWDLCIKLHPVQKLSASDAREIGRALYIDSIPSDRDIYDEVGAFDAVITDFSGIYFDFMITGKPIVMAPFEIDKYLASDRELYYTYTDICPDTPCETWDEVFDRLAALPPRGSPPPPRYGQLQRTFHRYLDANSTRRVVSELKALMGLS